MWSDLNITHLQLLCFTHSWLHRKVEELKSVQLIDGISAPQTKITKKQIEEIN